MLSRIFNMGTLKLAAALTILFGLVYLVWYAHQQAEEEMRRFNAEQSEKNKDSSVTVDNYELTEISNDNQMRWRLRAGSGVVEPSSKDVALSKVEVIFYKDGKDSMLLTAPTGKVNEISRKIILTAKEKELVVAIGIDDKKRLEAKHLELTKKNEFKATGGVNIVLPGVAKVSGDTAEGGLSGSSMGKMCVRGNTHSVIGI